MKTHDFQPNRRNGFTLVELLVVILIVLVLAALSFTMLTRMKKMSDQAVVTSNMRQLSMAMLTTVADKGRFPRRQTAANERWDRWILPAMGFSGEITGGVGDPIRPSQYPALETIAKTFAAPDDKVPREEDTYKLSFSNTTWTYNTGGNPFGGPKSPNEVPPLMSRIVRPERAAMIIQYYRDTSRLGSSNVPKAQAFPKELFESGQLVAFADGHVEKITKIYTDDEFKAKYEPITNGDQ